MSQSVSRNTLCGCAVLDSALEFQSEGPEHPQPSPPPTAALKGDGVDQLVESQSRGGAGV